MDSNKPLTIETLTQLFEEEKGVFSQALGEGNKYRPKADFFLGLKRIATLIYPSFRDESHMTHSFIQASWLPKVIKCEESILYLDTFTDVTSKTTQETKQSDVFLMMKTNHNDIFYRSTAYFVNEDVKYPTWEEDFSVSEENIFSLKDIIGPLNYSVSSRHTFLSAEPTLAYLRQNGFEIDFHYPLTEDILPVLDGYTYV